MKFNFKLVFALFFTGALGFGLAKFGTPAEELRFPQAQQGSDSMPKPILKSEEQSGSSASKMPRHQSSQMKDIRRQDSVFGILYHAFDLASKAEPELLRKMSTEALNDSDPLFAYNVAGIFIEKMVADDPHQAMAYAETLTNDAQRVNMVSHVLTSWVRYDEDEAFAYFQRIVNLQLKSDVGARFLMDGSLSRSFVAAVTKELGPLVEPIKERIRLRNTQPEDLFAQALTKTGADRNRDLRTAAWRWFSKDQETALQEISHLESTRERDSLMQTMLVGMLSRDPRRAMELLNNFASDNRKVTRAVLSAYATAAPAQAVDEVERYVSVTSDSRLLANLLASWVQKDPEAALQYAEGLSGDDQRLAYSKMARNYIQADPIAGLEWVASLPEDYESAHSVIYYSIDKKNVRAAEALIFEAGNTSVRAALMSAVSRVKAENDPASTLDWLGQFEGEGEYRKNYKATLRTWSELDPESAAGYIDQQKDLAVLYESFEIVASDWYSKDQRGAMNWVNSLPDSTQKHAAVAGLIKDNAGKAPDFAMELFESLPVGDHRDEAGLILIGELAVRDIEAARVATEKLGLSHVVTEAFLNAVRR